MSPSKITKKRREREREIKACLFVNKIRIDSEVGEVKRALSKLHIELIEIDIAKQQVPQFLLQQGFAQPLDKSSPGEIP